HPRMALRRINGTEIWVEESGPPGGGAGTIVWSHGLLFCTDLFAPQIAALRERYRCVAYDHRGQGKSARSAVRCVSMELLYQDAALLVESLGAGPVHFVGLSMGGFVGMRLAARRPDLVRSLVLLDTSADPEPPENLARYRAMSVAARVLGVAPLAPRLLRIFFAKSSLADPARRGDVARWRELLLRNDRSVWRAVNGVLERDAIAPELGRIRCPTLVGVGEEDVATVPAKAERLRELIAGAKLVRFPRAGHSSTLEAPAAVTAAIEAHLAEAR
ncbi:MAG TPA: alpha/beta fold hydrolase, partial [Minicystis sp.]|nr:alpha/beta fold hydrolase [Minicystis sp.]